MLCCIPQSLVVIETQVAAADHCKMPRQCQVHHGTTVIRCHCLTCLLQLKQTLAFAAGDGEFERHLQLANDRATLFYDQMAEKGEVTEADRTYEFQVRGSCRCCWWSCVAGKACVLSVHGVAAKHLLLCLCVRMSG